MDKTRKDISELVKVAESQSKMSEALLFFNLGVSEFYKNKTSNARYSAPYEEIGREFFNKNKIKIFNLLCNPRTKKPKYNIENDWIAIAGALLGDFTFGTVTTLVAILMRKGLNKFCTIKVRPDAKLNKKKLKRATRS